MDNPRPLDERTTCTIDGSPLFRTGVPVVEPCKLGDILDHSSGVETVPCLAGKDTLDHSEVTDMKVNSSLAGLGVNLVHTTDSNTMDITASAQHVHNAVSGAAHIKKQTDHLLKLTTDASRKIAATLFARPSYSRSHRLALPSSSVDTLSSTSTDDSLTATERLLRSQQRLLALLDRPVRMDEEKEASPHSAVPRGVKRSSDDTEHRNIVMALQRRRPVSRADIVQAQRLHNNLQHAASPAVIVDALRHNAWRNITVDPVAVQAAYRSAECLSCRLGKENRPPRSLGSGALEEPFSVIYVDYKSVNPLGIGGFVGFYMFVEQSTGYKAVVLVKQVPNAAIFVEAVRKIHGFFASHNKTLNIIRPDANDRIR